jgi:DNA-binding response OmpR family regulator
MNGFEVLRWIRQDARCSRLIVHVFSTSSRDVDVQLAYEWGANSYIVKPGRVDELVEFATVLQRWHGFMSFPKLSRFIEENQCAEG